MNPLFSSAMGQIVSQLFFYKDGFGIRLLMKVNMPLNKENQTYLQIQFFYHNSSTVALKEYQVNLASHSPV